jgi:cation diffusion facilitator family transporter
VLLRSGGVTTPTAPRSSTWVTVVLAFLANLAVAIAKSFAAAVTGSAAMVAEAAHSWADTGNEIFLLVAERRAARAPDDAHPYGYGRETYVWSMFAAFGLFTVGAAVSIWHGVQSLLVPEPTDDYAIAYIVLGVSAVFEGISFLQSLREARRTAAERGRGVLALVFRGSNSTLRAVFAEDSAALIGLAIAALSLLLHQLTGIAAFDAIGSILVGLLLAVVAVTLIEQNRRYLVGQTVDDDTRDAILQELLDSRVIERVTYLHVEFVGPARVYLVAAVDLTGDDPESTLAERLRDIALRIERVPYVQEAVLTPSFPGDAPLHPRRPGPGSVA